MSTSHAPGAVIAGRYELEHVIGRGSQGTTWCAIDMQSAHAERDRRRVALKAFSLSDAEDWKHAELFERESKVLARLSHPGIPRYHRVAQDRGTSFLVMDYVAGRSLKRVLEEDGPLGERDLWRVLTQTAEILAYLHGQSPAVVHRDIKPGNLIDGRVLSVVDFGGVRDVFRVDGGSTIVGTFGYMAPEQLHGEATPRTDLYALGATVVALGTGIAPDALPRKGLRLDFSEALRVSDKLRTLLEALLSPNPDDRPRDAGVLADMIAGTTAPPRGAREPEYVVGEVVDADMFDPGEPLDGDVVPLPSTMPAEMNALLGVLFSVVGVVGRVGLTLFSAVLLPLFFTVVGQLAPKSERKRLAAQKKETQAAVKSARKALKRLGKQGAREIDTSTRRLKRSKRRPKRLKGERRSTAARARKWDPSRQKRGRR